MTTSKPPSMSTALDNYIADIEEERTPDGMYHPSSMWMCARATILAVRGVVVANPPDTQVKRVFQIGHLMHRMVQDAVTFYGTGAQSEVGNYTFTPELEVLVPEWNIHGHADGLLELRNSDEWVIEIKSTKSLRFTPKKEHEKQAITYAECLRKLGRSNIKGIILVYLNKNDMEMKEYVIPRKAGWTKMVTDRVAELDRYRLPDTFGSPARADRDEFLPPILPFDKGKPNWYTNYCGYRGSGMCCGDLIQIIEEDFNW